MGFQRTKFFSFIWIIGSYRQDKIFEVLNQENILPIVLMAVGKSLP
ncbi:MAG: hypothetical protein GX428_09270 [Candidatus Atribacteria bacterium]|nr:hypothetical protein [Candidatus Atribacteria bacterium]